MDTPTLVTVLTPAFNRIDYIDEAIDSVLAQRCELLELIVIDDGSSDGTYERLLERSHAGDLTLLTHPNRANCGQAAALNLGTEAAKGEFIAILDSDDYFAKDKLETQLAYLQAHPEVGMVYGNGQAVDVTGKPLFKTLPSDHTEASDPNRILLDCYIAIPGGALIRKSVLDKVGGFDEGFRASQDHDMAIRIFEACKVAYLPNIAFCYRKHEDTISQSGAERRWLTGFEILSRAAKRWPYKPETLRKRRAVLNFRMGQTYLSQGRYIAALPCLLKSALADPGRAIKVLCGHEKAR